MTTAWQQWDDNECMTAMALWQQFDDDGMTTVGWRSWNDNGGNKHDSIMTMVWQWTHDDCMTTAHWRFWNYEWQQRDDSMVTIGWQGVWRWRELAWSESDDEAGMKATMWRRQEIAWRRLYDNMTRITWQSWNDDDATTPTASWRRCDNNAKTTTAWRRHVIITIEWRQHEYNGMTKKEQRQWNDDEYNWWVSLPLMCWGQNHLGVFQGTRRPSVASLLPYWRTAKGRCLVAISISMLMLFCAFRVREWSAPAKGANGAKLSNTASFALLSHLLLRNAPTAKNWTN